MASGHLSVTLLLDALATFRLTRLLAEDVVAEPVRLAWVRWAFRRAGVVWDRGEGERAAEVLERREDAPKLAVLITCPWCVSVYLAAGVVVVRHVVPQAWEPMARLLAFSAAAGLASAAVSEG